MYSFVLVGLKEHQYPNQFEKPVLVSSIRRAYPNINPREISLAIEMATDGKIDVESNPYGNFSWEYLGRIMRCYMDHRNKKAVEVVNENKKLQIETNYEPDSIQKVRIQQEFDRDVVMVVFDRWKRNRVLDCITTPPKLIYNSLVKYHKIIQLTREEMEVIKKQAVELIKTDYDRIKNSKVNSYKEHKFKLALLEGKTDQNKVESDIIEQCHRICIEKAFQVMEQKNTTL